jgi:Fe-S cluster biogenesis protein NfuA
MADGGNVEFVEIDGPTVRLKLQGACGSCPSSTTTMTMGIERRLKERIPEILEVEQARPTAARSARAHIRKLHCHGLQLSVVRRWAQG